MTSAKTDKIFWKIFEETLSRWLIGTTFLQIFSHLHFPGKSLAARPNAKNNQYLKHRNKCIVLVTWENWTVLGNIGKVFNLNIFLSNVG
jgi:hypothetical protein